MFDSAPPFLHPSFLQRKKRALKSRRPACSLIFLLTGHNASSFKRHTACEKAAGVSEPMVHSRMSSSQWVRQPCRHASYLLQSPQISTPPSQEIMRHTLWLFLASICYKRHESSVADCGSVARLGHLRDTSDNSLHFTSKNKSTGSLYEVAIKLPNGKSGI